jgi:hypothetical protein
MYQSSRPSVVHPKVSVTPKRLLAERLLRSVEARKSVTQAPSSSASSSSASSSTALSSSKRPVEVRSVIALDTTVLPRLSASGWEDPRSLLRRMFRQLKRTAQATKFQRLAERFASSKSSVASSEPEVSQFELVASRSVAFKSRLH